MLDEKESKCKTYECKKCNFVTIYANSYQKHIVSNKHNGILTRTRKPKEKVEKIPTVFKCDNCEYNSIYKYNRDNHYLKNHATEEERKKHFPYYCDACCYGTKSLSDNNYHIKSVQHNRLIKPYLETQKKLQNMKNT